MKTRVAADAFVRPAIHIKPPWPHPGRQRNRGRAALQGRVSAQKKSGLQPLRPPVLLWPDTFNNYFHPATARAAVEVLEAAGYPVTIPQAHLCCGRPLYDFGMLDRAESPAPRHPRPTRTRDRSRNPRHRPRAQLRRRLPRRTPQPLPPRPARPSPEQTNVPAQRIPRTRTPHQRPAARN